MNNLNHFLNKNNISLLWDVFLDEIKIDRNNIDLLKNIKIVFEANIKPFSKQINSNLPLIDINKNFLTQIVLAVNRIFPQLKNENQFKQIAISNEDISVPYKIEDIQAERKNNFELELEKKKMELENYMTFQKPKNLDFSDKNLDGKITAIDSLIAEKMAQRKLDIEQIQTNNNIIPPENWLKPTETSVKINKYMEQTNNNFSKNTGRPRYLNIDSNNSSISFDNDIIDLNKDLVSKSNKKVSWNENNVFLQVEESDSLEPSIFKKLKKTDIENTNTNVNTNKNANTNTNANIEQNKYIEQKSVPLSVYESKLDILQRSNTSSQNSVVTQNVPIIPNNEFVRQLNEMNDKIEKLYGTVEKILDLLSNKTNILESQHTFESNNNLESNTFE
jgi:hypothetical protein